MANEIFMKIRLYICCALIIVFSPLICATAIVYKLYNFFRSKDVCKSISGEVAVVTGAANGLGRAISIELAKQGCHVAVVDVKFEEALETAKLLSENYNVKAKAYKVDITKYEQVVQLNEQVTQDLGVTTILVNNAGIIIFPDPLNPTPAEEQRLIDVNLTSHFVTNRVFLTKMRELNRGHIVATSSMAGFLPIVHFDHYTASKHGVRGMMRCTRQKLKLEKCDNIHFTTIFPYFLKTHGQVVDIFSHSALSTLYPPIPGEDAAKRIINAILRNEKEVFIPDYMFLFCLIFEFIPADLSDWLCTKMFILNEETFSSTVDKIAQVNKGK